MGLRQVNAFLNHIICSLDAIKSMQQNQLFFHYLSSFVNLTLKKNINSMVLKKYRSYLTLIWLEDITIF